MGVHGLWELLAPVGRRVSVELLGNKKLAIDASIWIIQFLKAMRDDRGEVMRNAHLLGFFRRICKLLFLRVKPVFVFDGGTPFLKRRTVIARRRQREQAQSKIRKTAEKLLLNHLKAKKLEELVREEQPNAPDQARANGEIPSSSSQAKTSSDQENADALLAASLAKEWEEDGAIDLDSGSEEQQQILPVVNGKVDPEVLASLPPSMQLQLFDEMREQLVAENRQKFEKVAKAPSSFSKLQIEAYLKTVAFRRDINLVQKAAANISKDGVPSVRIASEANREYIFSTEAGKKKSQDGVQNVEETTAKQMSKDIEERGAADRSTVQTYLDSKGRKRVSRIRGMGVRMTRDLQWNLYLMKDKASQSKEDEAIELPADDESYAFEKLVSEDQIAVEEDGDETNVSAGQTNSTGMRVSFVDDGSLQPDELFARLVSESQPDEIEWEEDYGSDARISSAKEAQDEAGSGSLSRFQRNDVITETGAQNFQVSFVDDGNLEVDETFQTLARGQEDEEIDWEDDGHEVVSVCEPDARKQSKMIGIGDSALKTTGVMELNGNKQAEIQAGSTVLNQGERYERTKDMQADSHPPQADKVLPDAEKVEWEEDDNVAQNISENTSLVDVGEPDATKSEENHPLVSKPDDDKGTGGEEVARNVSPGKLIEQKPDNEDSCNIEHGKLTGVSDEQAQIEEAIRRSLVDFGLQKAFKPLTIQEPDSVKHGAVQDIEESERSRKGKAVLDNTLEKQANELENTEVVHDLDQSRKATMITEDEERFLDAEDRAARHARINEERENLLQEEAELRAEKKRNERNAETVTNEMFAECQELLQLFGIPYVVAPMEAEAQCAFMDAEDLVDGVITDDSDVFLFGGRSVYKNIFDGHKYVETYYMKDAESDLGLNRDKLIRMAMLLGSDYTEGISGIGIVNAIEVVNAFPEEDGLQKLRDWIESPDLMLLDKAQGVSRKSTKKSQDNLDGSDDAGVQLDKRKEIFMHKHRAVSKNWTIPSSFPSKAVVEAYECPQVDKSKETFSWGRPDLDLLRKFCFEKFGWTKEKADELLVPVLKEYDRHETQLRIDAFYSFNQRFAKIRSSRIQKAVSGITGQTLPEMIYGAIPATKKTRRIKPSDENSAPKPRKRKATAAGKKTEAAQRTPRKRQARAKGGAAKDTEAQVPEITTPAERTLDETPEDGGAREFVSTAEGSHSEDREFVPMEEDIAAFEAAEKSSGGGGGFILEDPEAREFAAPRAHASSGGGFILEDSEDLRGPTEEDLEAYEAEEMAEMERGGGFIAEDQDGEVRRQEENLEEFSLDRPGAPEEEDRREKQWRDERDGDEERRDPSLLAIPNFRRKRKSND
ncbi:DNA repair protein UVH3 isoform X1 [Selaginella moellendorffii]|uniref:DNA repair protein UVH3 isoform X1 n=2 Tax=Selaginella moellendorffii TaxID=88036 RepID=UPI000D1CBEC9|nr:DNA repair protein UVH3 isoform X1 [Selaginella moellendorffii]|eukprot:XP_002967370.2 DNA repair protein UVH3 isoform X1 [Selaginella moellendorffii]